jgi:uncharacterized protein (DUF1800 family)
LNEITKSDWTIARAAHLLNRAGFGGSPAEIKKLYGMGPIGAVDYLVDYESTEAGVEPPAFAREPIPDLPNRREMRDADEEERRAMQRKRRRSNQAWINQLRGWWFERMRTSPRPLEEKLTLFWHGHFATSFEKVKSAHAMYRQNATFRKNAAGSFENLVVEVSKDPAMLLYLDGARSKKKSPNENYARELMELFTLGEGNYSEEDIAEAARAFTGWTVNRKTRTFRKDSRNHDGGVKDFMGQSGRFDGEDIIRVILEHPAAAEFMSRKLWEFFAYFDPEREIVSELAAKLRGSGYELRPVLKSMFKSEAFYSTRAGRTQIKSPVQWLIGSLKVLDSPLPDPGLCTYMAASLGQTLFEPPNVKGWEGGSAWITTANLLHRYNLASVLVEGGDSVKEVFGDRGLGGREMGRMFMQEPMMDMDDAELRKNRRREMRKRRAAISRPVMKPDIVLPEEARESRDTARKHLQWRLFQSDLRPKDVAAFDRFFTDLPEPDAWSDQDIRAVVHAMMSTPQYQLT